MLQVKIIVQPGAKIPHYQTPHSSGADLYAFLDKPVVLQPLQRALIPTGISIELPPGFEAQIRPRSGLAINHGITLLNTPGTIDADYRGEIKLIVINLSDKPFTIENNMRIAQMVISHTIQATFEPVSELTQTIRNDGGFGHTGL
ncbi:MAG: dUTP diphosphatase [Spirochaetes bacterium]|nr:dUTP diphosphatase [Spirochaetota bacterium]